MFDQQRPTIECDRVRERSSLNRNITFDGLPRKRPRPRGAHQCNRRTSVLWTYVPVNPTYLGVNFIQWSSLGIRVGTA